MTESYRPATRNGFEVAIICALPVETDAVVAFFSKVWKLGDSYGKAEGDTNTYKTGCVGTLPVVLAYLPGMGGVPTAQVAANCRISFPNIKLCLVVGICGGVPKNGEKEILLGDVIMSGGLIDYSFGRQYSDNMYRKTDPEDALPRPSIEIRSFLKQWEGMGLKDLEDATCTQLDSLLKKSDFEGFKYPGPNEDKLFDPNYRHKHHLRPNSFNCRTCSNCNSRHDSVCDEATKSDCSVLRCDDSMLVTRTRLEKIKVILATQPAPKSTFEAIKRYKPEIHIGRVASANSVMKSSYHRDEIAKREKAIAFEMEGQGVWEVFPTIIIKAVCDYADSHKNKVWQPYAAAVAASCMRAVLEEWEYANIKERMKGDGGARDNINRYFEVPIDTNKNYVERIEISQKLETVFSNRKQNCITESRRAVLCGLSGSGKTEIAVKFAQDHRNDYFAVLWVNALDETRLQVDLGRIGKVLGSEADAPNPYSYTINWLSGNSDWLLIIDNLDNEKMMDLLRDEYINAGMRGDILITSNNFHSADQWKLVEVSDMRPHESRALIRKIIGSSVDKSEQAEMSALLNDLGHLPIAIDQAACYMRKTGTTAAEYRKLFAVKKCRLLYSRSSARYNRKHKNYERDGQPVYGVLPTWDISFNEITKAHPQAATLLLMMSLLYHDDIPMLLLESATQIRQYWSPNGEFEMHPESPRQIPKDLIETLTDKFLLREAIATLTALSFLSYKSSTSGYTSENNFVPLGLDENAKADTLPSFSRLYQISGHTGTTTALDISLGGNPSTSTKCFRMHPLVHFWASQKLKTDPRRPSLIEGITSLISGCFEKQDLLPPLFCTTHVRRGIEERSLSLWPWRQYSTIAPHALLCVQHVEDLDGISERLTCSILSLLQVFEYSSLGSLEKDQEISRQLIARLSHLRRCDPSQESSDQYVELCVMLWALHRREGCGCFKLTRDLDYQYTDVLDVIDTPSHLFCRGCESIFDTAEAMLNYNPKTARARALYRALEFWWESDGIWWVYRMFKEYKDKRFEQIRDSPNDSRFFDKGSGRLSWSTLSSLLLRGTREHPRSNDSEFSFATKRLFFSTSFVEANYKIIDAPDGSGKLLTVPGDDFFRSLIDTQVNKMSFITAPKNMLSSSEKMTKLQKQGSSTIERYQHACEVYLKVRSKWEVGVSDFRNIKSEIGAITETFEEVCGASSEEYRRTSFYRTGTIKGQWQLVEQILEPLVEASIENPIHSWSHERCVIRLSEALIQQGKHSEAKQVLFRIERAYHKTGRQFQSIKNMLLPTGTRIDEAKFQIFVKDIMGQTITLNVCAASTVESMIDALEEKMDFTRSAMRLIYGGKQLDYGRLLSDYSIQKGSTIHAVFRLCGGFKHKHT